MRFALVITCWFLVQFSIAQLSLTGRVIDTVTKQPIAGVSIFLSNTSIGTVSNEKGEFQILHIPQGKFELIASSLNYEPFITEIQSAQKPSMLSIQLKSSSNVLQEVIVESYDKDGWAKWGNYFTTNFIGTSSITKYCTLKNPDVIKFRINPRTNTVRAFAHENLIFENRALGYNIKYLLSKFEFNISTNTFKYTGYPLFENIVPENAAEEKKWESARLHTYQGSLMHFMRSVFSNQLIEEGFEVRAMKNVTETEKMRVKKLYKWIEQANKSKDSHSRETSQFNLNTDTLEYYLKVMKLSGDDERVIFSKITPRDSLIFPIDNSVESNAVLFAFDDYLHITYIHKKEPYEYTKFLLKRPNIDYISSDITLPFQKGISIYKNGTYFYGENLFTDGFWAWSEKLSTMLPTDYWPQK